MLYQVCIFYCLKLISQFFRVSIGALSLVWFVWFVWFVSSAWFIWFETMCYSKASRLELFRVTRAACTRRRGPFARTSYSYEYTVRIFLFCVSVRESGWFSFWFSYEHLFRIVFRIIFVPFSCDFRLILTWFRMSFVWFRLLKSNNNDNIPTVQFTRRFCPTMPWVKRITRKLSYSHYYGGP